MRDLVASQPGHEGKWFAAAKDAGFFELALELAHRRPADPRTLIRAARDFALKKLTFALDAGMTGLHGMANENGFDITGIDVLDASVAVISAANAAGIDEVMVKVDARELIAAIDGGGEFVGRMWAKRLAQ